MPFLQTLGGGSAHGFRASSGASDDEWVDASGGTESTSGDYKIHQFTSNGTFTLNSIPSDNSGFIELLMIAGGGGGGGRAGAGGGAGGVIWKRAQVVQQTGAISVVIGQGGNGGSPDNYGAGGGNTTFIGAGISLSAIGGGGAPGGNCNQNGNSGGSGAGGTYGGKGGSYTAGQGSHGGDSGGHHQGQGCSGGSYPYKEGGGGGYLGVGESGDVNNGFGRQGGAGAYFSISGSQVGYAGGGDGGGHTPWNGAVPNLSDFGCGTSGAGFVTGGNGTDGKGAGGGGASSSGGGTNYGGNGGDGRVIIRYRIQNTTGNATAGFMKSKPARRADDMLAWDPNIANGVYWLGNDESDARQVFCMFNPNGANTGGWMAVMTIGRQSDTGSTPNLCTANAVGTFPTDNPYIVGSVSQTKMSDTDIDFLANNFGGSHPWKILCDTWNWDGNDSSQGNNGNSHWKGNRGSPNGPGDIGGYPITTFPWPGSVIAAPDCVQGLPQRSVQQQWLRNTWYFDSDRSLDPSGGGNFASGNTSTRINANSRANISVLQTSSNNNFQFVDADNAPQCGDGNDNKSYILHFRKCSQNAAAAYSSLCDDSHTGWYSHSTSYNCYHGYNVVYVR